MRADQLFAQVWPEEIAVTETYRCMQTISQNPSRGMADEPSRGEIRVVVPYDAGENFPPAAIRALENRLTAESGAVDQEAQIGHLLLEGTEGTDLDRMLATVTRFGAVPLRIPITSQEVEFPALLRSDSRAAKFAVEYQPKTPEVPPVVVEMELMDADAARSEWLAFRVQRVRLGLSEAKKRARERPDRRRALLLRVDLRFELPDGASNDSSSSKLETDDEAEPRVTAQVELRWPAIPTPRTIFLHRPALEPEKQDGDKQLKEEVIYDPASRTLRWPAVPLRRMEVENYGGRKAFESGTMYLEIIHGEDLYGESSLKGQVEVEIAGRLLSGLKVAAFGPTGECAAAELTDCRTRVLTEVSLDLDDAVRKWIRSPVQELHFDHVILDELRRRDVRTALLDRGFEVDRDLFDEETPAGLIEAHRSEGAETLVLWVLLEGERYMTQRKTEVPGGQTFTTRVKSGRLTVYVRGLLRGSGGPVLEEIHFLHERLRHQFLATTDRR